MGRALTAAGALAACLLAAAATTTATATAPDVARAERPVDSALDIPDGFTDSVVATLAAPTGMAWTPDGRMLITQDRGQLRVVRDGQLLPDPALDLANRICSDGERGLMSVAVDPDFVANHYVYVYWTRDAHDSCAVASPSAPENRVTRMELGGNDHVLPGSRKVLVDDMVAPALNHIGGGLNFGRGGNLYISVGDGGCVIGDPTRCGPQNTNSRRLDIPHGKILRVTRSGRVPSSNPYVGAPKARRCTLSSGPQPGRGPCTETFASGFRNPFRFAPKPGTGTFYVNDVGQSSWEEIDLLRSGKDYGWNVREGHCVLASLVDCGPTTYQNPLHDYSHEATGCGSITGGAFVPDGVWPAPYDGAYLFADYVCGTVFRLVPDSGGGFTQQEFLTDSGAPVDLAFGPYRSTQALYYLEYGAGAVHRVTTTQAHTPPVARFFARPDGRTVTLDGSASYDPDAGGDITQWRWDFGDGTTATSATPVVTHTYPEVSTYVATLRVLDSAGTLSATSSRRVDAGEHPPDVTITAPSPADRYAVGESVTVTATADDEEDGTLPPAAISWTVQLHHNAHVHPYAGPVSGSSVTVDYPAPEDLTATETSHLLAVATVTDSSGLSSRSQLRLLPEQVAVRLDTVPGGGRVLVEDSAQTTPAILVSWPGYVIELAAPDQSIDGVPFVFGSWSDGGARVHEITTPDRPTAYTATLAARRAR